MTALSALSKEDPQGSARLRLDLAERFLAKAEEYVRKGTPFRCRRRGYRAAEEVVRPWPRGLTCLSTDRQRRRACDTLTSWRALRPHLLNLYMLSDKNR